MGTNIAKEEYANNLSILRKELNLTQLEMASFLEISDKMYRYYEQWTRPLPVYIAKKIAKKYNYSLDWIYCLSEKPKRTNQFMVDIRDVIKYENNRISIEIGSSFMKYLSEQEAVKNKNDTSQNKKNKISELDSNFIFEDYNVFDKLTIDVSKEKFMLIYKNNNTEIFVALGEDKINEDKITGAQEKEVQDFLKSIVNTKITKTKENE